MGSSSSISAVPPTIHLADKVRSSLETAVAAIRRRAAHLLRFQDQVRVQEGNAYSVDKLKLIPPRNSGGPGPALASTRISRLNFIPPRTHLQLDFRLRRAIPTGGVCVVEARRAPCRDRPAKAPQPRVSAPYPDGETSNGAHVKLAWITELRPPRTELPPATQPG